MVKSASNFNAVDRNVTIRFKQQNMFDAVKMRQLNLDSKREDSSSRFKANYLNTQRELHSNEQTLEASNKYVTESQHLKNNSSALFSRHLGGTGKVIGTRRIPSVDLNMPLIASGSGRPATSTKCTVKQSLRYRQQVANVTRRTIAALRPSLAAAESAGNAYADHFNKYS